MSLVVLPWDWNAPCHTHGCHNRISWRIMPKELSDSNGAVLVAMCDECKDHLLESMLTVAVPKEPAAKRPARSAS